MINISIVIYKTDFNELDSILSCCNSQEVNKIYIIDNSPENNIEDYINKKNNTKIIYAFNPSNPGYGASHNHAIKFSLSQNIKYHLVINSDIKFESRILKMMREFMDKNNDVGLLTPKILNENGSLQFSCRLLPTPIDMLQRAFSKLIISKRESKYLLKHFDHEKSFFCSYASGCFMFLRLSTIEEVGLFDERYFLYPEDIDLSRRISKLKLVLFYPKFVITHSHREESKKNLKMFFIHVIEICKYFNKWGWFNDEDRKILNNKVINQFSSK